MGGVGLIVVGVDGSGPARRALDFALGEAVHRSARVLAVTAFQVPEYWPLNSAVIVAPVSGQLEKLMEAAEREAREAVDAARRDAGAGAAAVPVDVRVVRGNPAKVLLDHAAGADLLVVGNRGRGALASACLGSVSLQCVLHAICPVVVVRDPSVETVSSGGAAAAGQ